MKLKLAEIAQLFEELNGKLLNSETGERSKGVLSHKLSVKVKYILVNELNKKLTEYVKEYEEAQLSIFKELVTQEENSYIVPAEKREELQFQLLELSNIEKFVEVPNIDVEELFNVETETYFPILLDKLLSKTEV
jgi:hypothetical protein